MSAIDHFILEQPLRHEIKIRRSVFIASLSPVADRDAAEAFIEARRAEFHNATHNCFAYRIDADQMRFSDDGEPSGTAGKPILTMLDKYHLIFSVAVVTRFYGGIKLGTGGLIRAYGNSAEEAILAAQQKAYLQKYVRYQQIYLHYPYHFTRQVDYIINKHRGRVTASQFETSIRMSVEIPEGNCQSFLEEIEKTGAGQIELKTKER